MNRIQKLIICTLLLLCSWGASNAQTPFIGIWKSDVIGSATGTVIPNIGNFSYTYVKTDDASVTGSGTTTGAYSTINFPSAGSYRISITPIDANFKFTYYGFSDAPELIQIEQWGSGFTWNPDLYGMFGTCKNLTVTATDIPDFSNATTMEFMFAFCDSLTNIPNSNSWNVSNVTSLKGLFARCFKFNSDVSDWDVSKNTTMWYTFSNCYLFDQDLSNWDVSNVVEMEAAFQNCIVFNSDISGWNVSNVKRTFAMFEQTKAFNQDLSSWDMRNVTISYGMFFGASGFNQNLGAWKMNSLELADYTFANSGMDCSNYSQTLMGWAANPDIKTGVKFANQTGMQYGTQGQTARTALINTKGWQISGDAFSACVLPVAFGNLSAIIKDNQLHINWQTLTERNNSHFEIQVSSNGRDFETIGTAKSKATNGNADTPLEYQYTVNDSQSYAFINWSIVAVAILLLVFRKKNRLTVGLSVMLVLAGAGFACNKNQDTVPSIEKDLFVRIVQVDSDGQRSISEIVKTIKK